MGKTSKDKMLPEGHYCNFWWVSKKPGKRHLCKSCGAVYTCKEVRGKLVWLQTRDGRK